jgi:hypothetical protein
MSVYRKIMELNPALYLRCNDLSGTSLVDHSRNVRHCDTNGTTTRNQAAITVGDPTARSCLFNGGRAAVPSAAKVSDGSSSFAFVFAFMYTGTVPNSGNSLDQKTAFSFDSCYGVLSNTGTDFVVGGRGSDGIYRNTLIALPSAFQNVPFFGYVKRTSGTLFGKLVDGSGVAYSASVAVPVNNQSATPSAAGNVGALAELTRAWSGRISEFAAFPAAPSDAALDSILTAMRLGADPALDPNGTAIGNTVSPVPDQVVILQDTAAGMRRVGSVNANEAGTWGANVTPGSGYFLLYLKDGCAPHCTGPHTVE